MLLGWPETEPLRNSIGDRACQARRREVCERRYCAVVLMPVRVGERTRARGAARHARTRRAMPEDATYRRARGGLGVGSTAGFVCMIVAYIQYMYLY